VLNALWQVKWSRMQSRTIADIERAIEALTPQQGEALHVWFDARFSDRETQTPTAVEPNPGSVVAQLRTLRARIRSDPEGWTTARLRQLWPSLMPPIVIDASVALAWALPDESSPYAEAALIVAEQEGMRVPELWAREIANGLAIAYNRKRINLDDSDIFLAAHRG